MDRMIHLNLRAMQGVLNRQTAIAHNMANADTTGFKAEIVTAQAKYLEGEGLQSRATVNEYVLTADLNPGAVKETGRPLDIAIGGQGMLAVQAPNGDEGYTRRGDLMMTESGLVTTGDGHPVLGEGGPLTLPPADSVRIAEDGGVWIVPAGGNPNQPQQVDRLRIVSTAGSEVVKGEDTLFRVKNGGVLPSNPDARLRSGALEGSNVNMTEALVDMIETSRAYETQVKLLTTAKEMDDGGASVMQLPR
ncbi:MAG: flagellar biosynthesis protein FlgF [Sphingomonadales bacterium CG12_big_fil_rev_8_21_14_0_65_65_10]|uniref:flagellar basal body rod protein FlgF n=1 Tax=Blastomonas marina TaxID=1867408 RepID=UPI000CBD0E01|nr:flagellar basal body rod protein FlgF [Blastomonas marina]PIW55827.1 MAG: flagellar biosynthesis protein FlgF [Sphingomonadales bacterium CG12_big_fil_rev_8_21_14_0_65_65_10]WPZ03587.1 flagellar basal body rod protein FlgF [Blastomonas marina]